MLTVNSRKTHESGSRFERSCGLTNSFADSCSRIHLVAIVALALVSSFQVNANLTADSRVQTLIDVCTQRPRQERKTECSWQMLNQWMIKIMGAFWRNKQLSHCIRCVFTARTLSPSPTTKAFLYRQHDATLKHNRENCFILNRSTFKLLTVFGEFRYCNYNRPGSSKTGL